ncbi:peptide MFS transporter [Corynebacterium kutscheri]|uniref:Transporter yclF n=1 Tax=Corynebacterium kutscheri TaxID=35755 RepID=A0AB38VQP3_9CORY|nr:oligopeptide:H+ symporter [Corynebacterium kutscheri]VEH05518.1 putative transporter yclF [Corynebacterium kutscheri]
MKKETKNITAAIATESAAATTVDVVEETITADRSTTATSARTPWQHPRATWSVVSIEAWERFSFYGLQAIMVFYLYAASATLTDDATPPAGGFGLGFSEQNATALIGAYGAMVYLCTFIGGWIGDRLLGPEKTLLGGALMVTIGHLTMSLIPSIGGLAIALLLIALGSGAVKTAAITVLGWAYQDKAVARDAGFHLFYSGIQVAAIAGPLLTGWLAFRYNYHVGFGAAAVLMLIGLTLYLVMRPRMYEGLSDDAVVGITQPTNQVSYRVALCWLAVLLFSFTLLIYLLWQEVVSFAGLATLFFAGTLCVAVGLYLTMYRSKATSISERRTMVAYIPLFFASCGFWTVAHQLYGVLAVYSQQRVQRVINGFEIPAAWTSALNPIFVIVLGVPFACVLTYLARKGVTVPTLTMMPLGVVIAGLGWLLFIPFAGGQANSTPYYILVLVIAIGSAGELFIGPIGMSATVAHAPAAFKTRFSALFFLTLAVGASLAGVFSQFYSAEQEVRYFLSVSGLAVAMGLMSWILYLALRRLK